MDQDEEKNPGGLQKITGAAAPAGPPKEFSEKLAQKMTEAASPAGPPKEFSEMERKILGPCWGVCSGLTFFGVR